VILWKHVYDDSVTSTEQRGSGFDAIDVGSAGCTCVDVLAVDEDNDVIHGLTS
jgi:hypothetical protein